MAALVETPLIQSACISFTPNTGKYSLRAQVAQTVPAASGPGVDVLASTSKPVVIPDLLGTASDAEKAVINAYLELIVARSGLGS